MQVGGTLLFWRVKRLGDIILSAILLPLLVFFAVSVWLLNFRFNPGPLIFAQWRVGRHDRLFVMYKFRTMRPTPGGARFANTETHRIGRFGQLLRRYRIDELPQIINVLSGDMSLIGPRPEQPEFVRHYQNALPGYGKRHCIRPGLSGLSQVVQGYTSDTSGTRRKLALDLTYIRRSGFRMEAYIFWRTVKTVVTGFGAL